MSGARTWTSVLDELEARIESTEAALDADDILLDALAGPFDPPTDLGPLPEHLTDRARDVLRRQLETQQRITESLASVKRDISKATQQRGAANKANAYRDAPVAQYFDSNI